MLNFGIFQKRNLIDDVILTVQTRYQSSPKSFKRYCGFFHTFHIIRNWINRIFSQTRMEHLGWNIQCIHWRRMSLHCIAIVTFTSWSVLYSYMREELVNLDVVIIKKDDLNNMNRQFYAKCANRWELLLHAIFFSSCFFLTDTRFEAGPPWRLGLVYLVHFCRVLGVLRNLPQFYGAAVEARLSQNLDFLIFLQI